MPHCCYLLLKGGNKRKLTFVCLRFGIHMQRTAEDHENVPHTHSHISPDTCHCFRCGNLYENYNKYVDDVLTKTL